MNENEFGGLYKLLAKNKLKELRDELSDMAYPDIAEFIMDLDDDKISVKIFRILPKDISCRKHPQVNSFDSAKIMPF